MKKHVVVAFCIVVLAASAFAFEAPRAVVLSNQAVPDGRAAHSTSERAVEDELLNMGYSDGANGIIRTYKCNLCDCCCSMDEGRHDVGLKRCARCPHPMSYHVVSNREQEFGCRDNTSGVGRDGNSSNWLLTTFALVFTLLFLMLLYAAEKHPLACVLRCMFYGGVGLLVICKPLVWMRMWLLERIGLFGAWALFIIACALVALWVLFRIGAAVDAVILPRREERRKREELLRKARIEEADKEFYEKCRKLDESINKRLEAEARKKRQRRKSSKKRVAKRKGDTA